MPKALLGDQVKLIGGEVSFFGEKVYDNIYL